MMLMKIASTGYPLQFIYTLEGPRVYTRSVHQGRKLRDSNLAAYVLRSPIRTQRIIFSLILYGPSNPAYTPGPDT